MNKKFNTAIVLITAVFLLVFATTCTQENDPRQLGAYEAYKIVDDGMINRTNENIARVKQWEEKFKLILSDPTKKEYADAYVNIKTSSDELIVYIDGLLPLFAAREKKDKDLANKLMITEGEGKMLKGKIEQTRKVFATQKMWDEEDVQFITDSLTLAVLYNEKSAQSNGMNSWEEYNFKNVPAIAVVTLLNKFRNDTRNSEALVLERLYHKATEKN